MIVGYAVERFPVLSQTFVSAEVAELERQGVGVVVASLWPGDDGIKTTTPVVPVRDRLGGRRRLLADHLHFLLWHPLRYARFLRVARGLGAERDQIAWRRLPQHARRLEAAGVDRLHAHFAWGGAALAMALSALAGWPWAMTMHARDIFADRRNLRAKLDDADLLITVCDFNRRYLRDTLHVRRPVELVICGVDVPPVAPADERDLDVVFIGRMVEKKGVDVLLRAFRSVCASRPDLRLHLVGDGPLLEQMRTLAAELGVASRVQFLGALPHDETLELLARTRVFCLPARMAPDGDVDSMPLVIKEAMARSVAVVACDAGGVAEMVDGTTGLLVAPDDVTGLAEAIGGLLDDDFRRREIAAAGRAKVERSFTLTGEVAKLRGLLSATLR